MFRPRHVSPGSRRGIILLLVISMLTLFAIIGISFVYYAESEATSARVYREAEQPPRPDTDPELLLSFFLDQLIYGTDDTNLYSAMRGHDLMRNMFGGGTVQNANGTTSHTNMIPYSGTGRLRSEWPQVNYQVRGGTRRDPERYRARPTGHVMNWGVPYTYPDHNNMFLAAVKPDGTVLVPSWRRPWTEKIGDPLLSLRPPELPTPENPGGDVKNLANSPGYFDGQNYYNNDSIWMDLGFPVRISPDGRKFKPLFASLVMDLDNRVNVGVHGNLHLNKQAHASNQGWGRWEVNVGRVLSNPKSPNEWVNLFKGNPRFNTQPKGRYGTDSKIDDGTLPTNVPTGKFYSMVDFNGAREDGSGMSSKLALPSGLECFALTANRQNSNGYGNGSQAELNYHGSMYHYAGAGGDDRPIWHPGNMEALLRLNDTGSPALLSDLYRLCPVNLSDTKTRNLITTMSFDWERPGASPYIWTQDLSLDVTKSPYPTGNPQPFQPPRNTTTVPQGSEYDSQYWRSTYSFSSKNKNGSITGPLRLDLAMTFPPYPAPGSQDFATFTVAQTARQNYAKALYDRLRALTGAPDPATDAPASPNPTDPNSKGGPGFEANRWLAQLAVNIVDYIDDDDVITTFKWFSKPTPQGVTPPLDWYVYGTELPRVVINEALLVYENDPQDTSLTKNPKQPKASRYLGKVWVELLNPMHDAKDIPGASPLSNNGTATLEVAGTGPMNPATGKYQNPAIGCYRLLITQPNTKPGLSGPLAQGNSTGAPDDMNAAVQGSNGHLNYHTDSTVQPFPADQTRGFDKKNPQLNFHLSPGGTTGQRVLCMVDQWINDPDGKDKRTIAPSNASAGGQGYYVIGPPPPDLQSVQPPPPPTILNPATMPLLQSTTCQRRDMQFRVTATTLETSGMPKPTVMLQRLACPSMPYNDPNDPNGFIQSWPVNPYVTVDYIENLQGHFMATIGSQGQDQQTMQAKPKPAEPVAQVRSVGRMQPFAADPSQWQAQQPPNANPGQISTTFLSANSPHGGSKGANSGFDWLTHMDRPLISPIELMNVSTYKPHELTHKFISQDPKTGQISPHQHCALWSDQAALKASRVYRLLEFLCCHDRCKGMLSWSGVGQVASMIPVGAPDPTTGLAKMVVAMTTNPSNPQTLGSDTTTPSRVGWGVPWSFGPGTNLSIGTEATTVVSRIDDTSFYVMARNPAKPGTPVYAGQIDERIPGKINLNTLWGDPDTEGGLVFQALCDAQPSNYFTAGDVRSIYQKLVSSRTPSGLPGPNDRPFWGMGQGEAPASDTQYPGGGLENSWLRSTTGDAQGRIFNTPQGTGHPYLRNQLLNKIYNYITPRSNVFAVFLTVGFFEVADDTQLPVTLGNEIGKSEGRHIRHRMFAIVDRTYEATTWHTGPGGGASTLGGVSVQGGNRTVTLKISNGTNIKQGSKVDIYEQKTVTPPPRPIRNPQTGKVGYQQDPPYTVLINFETVTIIAADPPQSPTSITAVFTQPHGPGSTVNPYVDGIGTPRYNNGGIDSRFSPADRAGIVPFFSVIE